MYYFLFLNQAIIDMINGDWLIILLLETEDTWIAGRQAAYSRPTPRLSPPATCSKRVTLASLRPC